MRVDKFLKVSRVIKRRTVAKEVAENSRILVNGKIVKPSFHIKEQDEITILFGNKEITIRVIAIKDSTKKADANLMYELVSEIKRGN